MKKILIFILLFLPLFHVSAVNTLEVDLNKKSYVPGDKILLKAVFTNTYSQEIKGILFCSFVAPNHEMAPMPTMKEVELKPGRSDKLECAMTVGEAMPEGIYKAQAEVMDQNKNTVVKSEKEFIVSGTKKEIKAELLLCGDSKCKNRKVVFTQNEKIYAQLNTNTNDINIKATLNGELINFDNYLVTIDPEKEGSFVIDLNLSKDGFISKEFKKDFAVIAAPAQIESASVCKINSKCEGQETEQNCPQDCLIALGEKNNVKANIFNSRNIVLFIILLLAFVLMFMGYKIIKNKSDQI